MSADEGKISRFRILRRSELKHIRQEEAENQNVERPGETPGFPPSEGACWVLRHIRNGPILFHL